MSDWSVAYRSMSYKEQPGKAYGGRFLKLIRVPVGLCIAMLFLAALTGCGLGPDSTTYGSVTYPMKNSSINGLGVFEKLCNQAGTRCIVANRFSSRLEKVEAIILVGDSMHPPAKEARDWIEEWLAAKPGRSVVYFGRDFDADIYYRQRTLDQVPAASQQRAEIDLMIAKTRLDTQLLRQIPDDVFCRWFTLRIHRPQHEVKQFSGPWGDALAGEAVVWPVRVVLAPPDPAQAANKPKWPPQAVSVTLRGRVGTPNPPAQNQDGAPVVFTSQWSQWDIGDDETWKKEWEKAPDAEVLLSGQDGTPLITRLTSERYPDSQILTIVNGAPLLNGTLVEPHFRRLAHKIIEDLQPAKRIALIPFNEFGILVSRLDEDENELAGLSVLTTWPMNIVVAHLAFLGILICMALFPILGRPQKLRPRSLADFGQHAESLGQMLQRTGDLSFALRAIADYYRTVRGEVVPSWVESALQQTSAPLHSTAVTPAGTAGPATDAAVNAPTTPASDLPLTSPPVQPQSQTGSSTDSSA